MNLASGKFIKLCENRADFGAETVVVYQATCLPGGVNEIFQQGATFLATAKRKSS